ncbi:related to protein RIS1 [Rhynchosporium graminicola]|uniref:Related to protein RIS1 n=1 Tax=Rhynchosporium graminicola TaxID=2792576 RepID=A0A1E1JZX2_9HELO|nr:related to protein RIS1 [Rhynchosporium commune]
MALDFENTSGDFMDEDPYQVHDPEPEPEPDTELPQDQPIPSIERTAYVLEPRKEQAIKTPQSTSPSNIKDEAQSSTVPSTKYTPEVQRGVPSDEFRTPEGSPAGSAQLPATASPDRRVVYSSTSSLKAVLAPAPPIVFGALLRPPPEPSSSSYMKGKPVNKPIHPIQGNGGPVTQSSTPTATQPDRMILDDDDDCIIIDPSQASLANQEKWKSASPRVLEDEVVFVKEEKRAPTPLSAVPASTGVLEKMMEKRRVGPRSSNPSVRGSGPPRSNLTLPSVPSARAPVPPRSKKPDLTAARMLSAQSAMLSRNRFIPYDNGEGSSRGHMRGTPARNFNHYENDAFGPAEQQDSVMGGTPQEDTAWMDEEEEEEGADSVYDGWINTRNQLLRKQRNNTITTDESLRLFKLKQNIETRDRLCTTATQEEEHELDQDPDSLFLAESREQTISRRQVERQRRLSEDRELESLDKAGKAANGNWDGEYDEHEAMARMFAEADEPDPRDQPEDLGFTKAGKPRKRRAKNAKTASEYVSRQEEQRREKERAKAQKNKTNGRKVKSPVAVKGKGKGKAKDLGKSKRGKTKSKGKGKEVFTHGQSLLAPGNFRRFDKNQDTAAMMILEDLMSNDPINDRLQNPIFNRSAENEIIGSQTKATQFQLLFANIPEPEDEVERGAVRNDKAKLRDASKSFGYAKCKAVNGKWLIKGMKSTLYHHQLLGAQWMVKRELSSQPPHGGILADSMGLGKTVQTLACMVGNAPGDEDRKRKVKATLIIGPATICSQWIDEIATHVDPKVFPKIILYKTSSNLSPGVLEDADIVVASYHTVCSQFPFPNKEGKLEIARDGYQSWHKKAVANMGVLHRVNWYRVVLDEAQSIKNNASRTSLACQNLVSVYRWCLSGTPLLNRLEELFPYLRFLKANYSMNWSMFQKYFCDPNHTDSNNRIATLLSYTMMRRTMKTSILNRPIITLPEPLAKVMDVQFSAEETIIYRITENRFRKNLNTFFKQGDASRNYGIFMVQLLRLRQCTSHPFMLERTIKESWTTEDVQELEKLLNKFQTNGKPFYEQCKLWVETNEAHREAARDRGEVVQDDEMLPFGRSSFGHTFDMDHALQTLNETDLYERVTCSLCADIPTDAHKTDCGHIFCKDCIHTFAAQLVAQGDNYMTCPQCNRVFNQVSRMSRPDAEPIRTSRRSKSQSKKGKGTGKERQRDQDDDDDSDGEANENLKLSKGKDLMGFEPKTADSSWVTKSDIDPDFPLTPSTKTAALKALLLKGFAEAPLDKVVIYVQFRTLARIIGRLCNAEGWGFLYLTGDASLDHREKAIRRFRDDPHAMILVAGLKCGGLGLNFPFANRCISLDLWWNHAVEQQAFGRIFRIGQKKKTFMTRIVVRNTVDMRMLAMQVHKMQDIEKAIPQAGDMKERQNLTLNQLANLFGFLISDGDGQIVSVEADYRDEEEGDGGGLGGDAGGGEDGDGEGRRGRGGDRKRTNTGVRAWEDVTMEGYSNGMEENVQEGNGSGGRGQNRGYENAEQGYGNNVFEQAVDEDEDI